MKYNIDQSIHCLVTLGKITRMVFAVIVVSLHLRAMSVLPRGGKYQANSFRLWAQNPAVTCIFASKMHSNMPDELNSRSRDHTRFIKQTLTMRLCQWLLSPKEPGLNPPFLPSHRSKPSKATYRGLGERCKLPRAGLELQVGTSAVSPSGVWGGAP